MDFTIVRHEDEVSITVFYEGETHLATSTHEHFDRIKEGLLNDDESIIDLFNIPEGISRRFKRLTERITVANGRVYFDGDEVDNALTKLIIRFIDEDKDFWPLVLFFENLQQNPNENSRNELFKWLNANSFAITDGGDIVAYKGVTNDFLSTRYGRAIVNDEVVEGQIPNQPDSIIEMPRSEVRYDPTEACQVGLHVATWKFAENWSKRVVELHVNPRDVVSVPTYDHDKMRVCRYYVVDEVTEPFEGALRLGSESTGGLLDPDVGEKLTKELDEAAELLAEDLKAPENPQKPSGRHPTQKEIDSLKALAKKRKRGFVRTAREKGWKLIDPLFNLGVESWFIPTIERHPTDAERLHIALLAKRRKRGFVRTAKEHGWKLIDESNPNDSGSWLVSE